MLVRGSAWQDKSAVRVRGREVAWAPTPAVSTTDVGSRGKGGPNTVGSPATRTWFFGSGADTAVSIEREVVFGHAYAILAPHAVVGGRCGYDKPANVSVDGVLTR